MSKASTGELGPIFGQQQADPRHDPVAEAELDAMIYAVQRDMEDVHGLDPIMEAVLWARLASLASLKQRKMLDPVLNKVHCELELAIERGDDRQLQADLARRLTAILEFRRDARA